MINKLLNNYSPIIQVLTLILVGVLVFGGGSVLRLGGTTNYDALDVTDGYYVDASQVIDGSGNWVGTGTFTLANTLIQSGASYFTGALIADSIGSGILINVDATSTILTAANICDNTIVNRTVTDYTASTTLPAATLLQADCLGTNGSYRDVLFRNNGTATTTMVFTAGASTTLQTASSTGTSAIAGGNSGLLRFYSVTSTESEATMIEIQVFEPFQ